jgi:putative hemolysin
MTYKLLIALGMAAAITLAIMLIGGGTMAMGRFLSTQSTPAAGADHAFAELESFCTGGGGVLVMRTAAQFPDADPPAALGEPAPFCEFTGAAGADEGSTISVLAETLATGNPTLAAMAYLEGKPMPAIDPAGPSGTPGASVAIPNPASIYCQQAGGAEGAWVAMDMSADSPFRTITMCVFPDRSAIDSWGLAYHAMDGTIRGADLASIFAWKR